MAEPIRSLPLTYDDYLRLPEDGPRYELIEGELLMTPAPTVTHQTLLGRFFVAISIFLAKSPLGRILFAPVDVVLSPANVVQPDLLFIAKEHYDRITEPGIQGAPDLVIEILSKRSRRHDEVTKLRLYAKFGVAEYWIADRFAAAVRVYRLEGDRYRLATERKGEAGGRLTSPLLPGLEIDLAELFAGG